MSAGLGTSNFRNPFIVPERALVREEDFMVDLPPPTRNDYVYRAIQADMISVSEARRLI